MGKIILIFLKKNRWKICLMIMFLVLIGLSTSIMPFFTAKIIDEGFSIGNVRNVLINATLILLLQFLVAIVYVIVEHIRLTLYNKIHTELKKESIKRLFILPISFFNNKTSTSIYQQLEEDILTISSCLSYEVINPLSYIVVALFLIPALISISLKLTLLTFACIPFYLLLTYVFSKLGYKYSKMKIDADNEYSACIHNTVSGMQTIRLFGLKRHYFDEFLQKQQIINQSKYKIGLFQNINLQSEGTFGNIIGFALYVVGGWLIVSKELTLGQFISFETYSLSVLAFVRQILSLVYGYYSLKPSVERLNSFFVEPTESQSGLDFTEGNVDILFKIRSFGYDGKSDLLKNIFLTIPHGKHIAFIGENGSGKTTLINLLLRIYPVQDGRIFVNDKDVLTYNLNSYRKIFNVLEQEPYLFCDTIENNICLYRDVPKEKLEQAIKLSGLTRLVKEKTLSYCIGENGCELSGGQRQRLSIARSIVTDAPIVVLDEPEVNMDTDFHDILASLLNEVFKEKTVIMITHNKSVINLFDETYQVKDHTIKRI